MNDRERGDNVVPVETVNMAAATLEVTDVVRNLRLIQRVLKEVLVEGQNRDYGSPPGTTGKVLYKAGAEKLGMLFRLAPNYHVSSERLQGDHRDVVVRCELIHIGTGAKVAEGVGSCSTMEKKYRWRYVYEHGRRTNERVENEDIADCWNTVLKQAKKRAHVDAMLTAIAASDMFTQDLEDADDGPKPGAGRSERKPPEDPELKRARVALSKCWQECQKVGITKKDFVATACSVRGDAVTNPFQELTALEMDALRESCEEAIAKRVEANDEEEPPVEDSEQPEEAEADGESNLAAG